MVQDAILCIEKHQFNLESHENVLCNFVVVNAKWEIWKHRNRVKYDKIQQINSQLLIKNIILSCRKNIDTLLASSKSSTLDNKTTRLLELLQNYCIA